LRLSIDLIVANLDLILLTLDACRDAWGRKIEKSDLSAPAKARLLGNPQRPPLAVVRLSSGFNSHNPHRGNSDWREVLEFRGI
jgi:hypothetical protein